MPSSPGASAATTRLSVRSWNSRRCSRWTTFRASRRTRHPPQRGPARRRCRFVGKSTPFAPRRQQPRPLHRRNRGSKVRHSPRTVLAALATLKVCPTAKAIQQGAGKIGVPQRCRRPRGPFAGLVLFPRPSCRRRAVLFRCRMTRPRLCRAGGSAGGLWRLPCPFQSAL